MKTAMSIPNQKMRSSGFTLIEVLVSFLVMAVGLVALLSFHSTTQTNAAEAKMQSEATSLAEAKLREIQSYLGDSDDRLDENAGDGSDSPEGKITDYTRSWTVTDASPSCNDPDAETCLKTAEVTISWTDRNEEQQELTLTSNIHSREPTRDPQNLLTVAKASLDTDSSGEWVEGGGGQQDGDNTDDQTGNGDDGQNGNGNDRETDPGTATYTCACSYKNNPGYTLESGEGCCSVSGCSQSDPNDQQNNTGWEYTCAVN